MSDTLYIRLDASSDQASWCLHQPPSGYGHVQTGALDDALLLARERRLIVIVPSADITLTVAELPAQLQTMAQDKLLKAIPFLLEDRLAEEVETLHFAVGRRSGAQLPVVIAAQARMEGWLQPFRERGVVPAALVPDLLCVPRVQDEVPVWSVLLENEHAMVRSGACAGFSCETEMLPDFLTLAEAPEKLRLQLYPVEHAELPTLELPAQTSASVSNGLEYLMRGFDAAHSINLLQGTYAAAPEYLNWFLPWRMTAVLLAAWLVLGTLTMAVEYLRLRHELRGLENTAETAFRAAFPQVTRIVDLRAQAQQQLAALKRAGGSGGFLQLLQGSSQVLARLGGVQLQEIQFREGGLHLALLAGNTQALDNLQQAFAQQPGLRLEVESANATAEGVQIRAAVKVRP